MKIRIKQIILLVVIFVLSINSTIQFLYYQNGKKSDIIKITGEVNKEKSKIELSKFNINGENFYLPNFANENSTYNVGTYSLDFKSKFVIEKKVSIFSDYSIVFNLNKGDKISFFINGEKKQDFIGDKIGDVKEITRDTSVIVELKSIIKSNIKIGIFILFMFIFIYYILINKIGIPIIKKMLEGKTNLKYIILYSIVLFIIFSTNLLILFAINKLFIILITLFLIALEYILFKKMIIKNILYIYIAFIIPISIIFGFVILPFSVPDEASHLYKSFMVSDKIIGENNIHKDINGGYTYILPENVYEFVNNYTQELSSIEYSVKPKSILLGSNKIKNNKKSENNVYVNSVKYLYDLAYIPAALVLTIFRKINFGIIPMFYLCRYINLLLSHILIAISIKNIPKFKRVLLLTASLPILLQQSNAINQDCLTNALYIFMFYLIINIKYSNRKSKDNLAYYIQLLLSGLLICFCKMGYFLIIYLLFLFQNSKKSNKKIELLIMLVVSGCFIFTMLNSYSANIVSTGTYDINYIIHNPINGILLYIKTFIMKADYLLFRGLFDSFYYSTKSHQGIISFIIQFIYIYLILTSNEENDNLGFKNKLIILGISFLQLSVIFTAMLSCSPLGDPFISGLQARYFIPVFMMLLFAIPTSTIKYIGKMNINKMWSLMICIVEVLCIFTIVTKSFI